MLGRAGREPVLDWEKFRIGDDVRRARVRVPLVEAPRTGEPLRSAGSRSWSRTEVRTGDVMGNASSTGFRGVRTRLGDCAGLAGRSCGEKSRWPEPVTPGMDCVRPMGAAPMLAADRERMCEMPERGEVVRGR